MAWIKKLTSISKNKNLHKKKSVGAPCYGHTKEEPCGKYYIAALKDHVNLGFSLKGLSKEEISFFEGSGETMKHLKFYSVKDIDEKKITKLLRMLKEK